MAHKPKSFKLNEKKKVIILYSNVRLPEETDLINFYLSSGYKPMYEEKKATVKVEDMRKELESDKETLKKFEEAYSEKNGFFKACKVYQAWLKEKKEKNKEENKEENKENK